MSQNDTSQFDRQLFASYLRAALANLARAHWLLIEYIHDYCQRYRA